MNYETALFIIFVIWLLMPDTCHKKRKPRPLDDMDYTFMSPDEIDAHYKDYD